MDGGALRGALYRRVVVKVITEAHFAFYENMERAEALLRIFERGRKRGRPRKEDTQLPRSSVVFSIGALDAYLHDLVLEIVAREVPPSDDLDAVLKGIAPHDLVQRMARADDLGAAREVLRDALDKHFDDKSFMDVSGLLRALRLVGCRMTTEELAAEAGEPELAAKLGRYTDIRHGIIHRGERVDVHKAKAWECAELVRSIVRVVDDAVTARYG
jgi:hypothetical protein